MRFFAAILTEKDKEKSDQYRPMHKDFLQRMKSEKKVIMYGKYGTDKGIAVYVANDIEEATSLLKQDPYIEMDARDWEIHEWELVSAFDLTFK